MLRGLEYRVTGIKLGHTGMWEILFSGMEEVQASSIYNDAAHSRKYRRLLLQKRTATVFDSEAWETAYISTYERKG